MRAGTVLAVGAVLALALGLAGYHFWSGRPEPVEAPSVAEGSSSAREGGASQLPTSSADPGAADAARNGPASPGASGAKRVVVDIAGKVREPGVHRLPSGSRVADAIKAAGGLRRGADTKDLNRARVLVDGEQIVVGVPQRDNGPPQGGASAPAAGAGAGGAGASSGAGAGGGASPEASVSLNSATAEQLQSLPGVGPVLAQHILDHREERGGFTSVEQLKDVNGIGESRFEELAPRVSP